MPTQIFCHTCAVIFPMEYLPQHLLDNHLHAHTSDDEDVPIPVLEQNATFPSISSPNTSVNHYTTAQDDWYEQTISQSASIDLSETGVFWIGEGFEVRYNGQLVCVAGTAPQGYRILNQHHYLMRNSQD